MGSDKGLILNKNNLGIFLGIVSILTLIISLAVGAADVKSELNHQKEKIDTLEIRTDSNTRTINEINTKLSSIDANLEFIKKELSKTGGN